MEPLEQYLEHPVLQMQTLESAVLLVALMMIPLNPELGRLCMSADSPVSRSRQCSFPRTDPHITRTRV